ncbi:MAG: EamA family transporter RarD [Candidatus Sumerlaeaceae bacterium]|nr:EamA family transporter RarD [Candidatus Sumerlaeaceae bacterium]
MAEGSSSHDLRERRKGVAYAVLAFTWWGLMPLYFKAVIHVEPMEVLAHRVVWALVFSGLLMTMSGRWSASLAALRGVRPVLMLSASSALLAVNWGIFIWAVGQKRVMETSFGYYINPLVSMLLGVVFLRERLDRLQGFAVLLAATGMSVLAWHLGGFPWISITLALTFGLYGLLRKTVPVDSLAGLTFECVVLLPVAAGYLGWRIQAGTDWFTHAGWHTTVLLIAAGPATALPLIWFGSAARRIRLVTVGFLQYIGPTLTFSLAVLVFREPFSQAHLMTTCFIALAITVFSWSVMRTVREEALPASARPVAPEI